MTTLTVAVPDLVSPSYFPAVAAVELGLFREQGLDARVELVFPVTRTYEALRDGELDYVAGAAHAALYAFPEWAGCRLLCAVSRNMYWFLVVRRELQPRRGDLAVLRGLRIAAAPGPVDGLRRMLVGSGLDPDDDVELVPVPASSQPGVSFGVAAAQALAAGAVDGFWANGMAAEIALREGVGALVLDSRRGDGPPGAADYTFPALVATQERIEHRPEEVAAAVRAVAAAHDALRADPAKATTAAAPHFPEAELGLIPELIRRDAPFYDPALTPDMIAALNRFAADLGLLASADVPYGRVVADRI